MPKNGSVDVSLKTLQCEVFTIAPIKVYRDIQFAPIGLIKMYNSGGAVEAMDFFNEDSHLRLRIKGRGPGPFGAYSSTKPKICTVNSKEEEFEFISTVDGFLTLVIPSETNSWEINLYFEA